MADDAATRTQEREAIAAAHLQDAAESYKRLLSGVSAASEPKRRAVEHQLPAAVPEVRITPAGAPLQPVSVVPLPAAADTMVVDVAPAPLPRTYAEMNALLNRTGKVAASALTAQSGGAHMYIPERTPTKESQGFHGLQVPSHPNPA